MRLYSVAQGFLNFNKKVNHPIAKELKMIDQLIYDNPQMLNMVGIDLMEGKADTGRYGMSAEQVLKAALLKQFYSDSYEKLAFRIQDSITTREFMKIESFKDISKSTLQENIKMIRSGTWDYINLEILKEAIEKEVESGEAVRTDSTVVETNIHHPTDSSLLWDSIRVLNREFKKIRKLLNDNSIKTGVSLKVVKRNYFRIVNSKNEEKRKPHYEKLLKQASTAYSNLVDVMEKIKKINLESFEDDLGKSIEEIKRLEPLFKNIINQTVKRVLEGKRLKPEEKVVSIFEEHTDIIVKDRRETLFGHKIFITSGKSNLIIDYDIPRGNPSDKIKLAPMLKNLQENYDIIPNDLAADGGFTSSENFKEAIELGIKNIAFGRDLGNNKNSFKDKCHEKLKNWRAGIEGIISYLKRSFGLTRCDWKGFEGFLQYVKISIATYNLRILARHLMA
jgi:transposase, IS5 family